MSNKSIYKITIANWSKYNGNIKKGHKATLIANNFCTDSKLSVLPLSHRWLFLGLLLTCGDHTSDTIEMSERHIRDLLESSKSVSSALDSLQSLQLLSYEKNDVFLNRIEKNRKEKKVKEENICADVSPTLPTPVKNVDRRGTIPELNHPDVLYLFDTVTKETQTAWLKAYPNAPWIIHEALKANVWIKANPHKAPKNFARFFSNWLSKAFEDYRKGLPSNRAGNSVNDHNEAIRRQFESEGNNAGT